MIYLITKGSARLDPKKVKPTDLEDFNKIWENLKVPLHDYFEEFIWGQFKINNKSIIPKKLAILPMIIYFYEIYKKGTDFKRIDSFNLLRLKQYFIPSQINDWNLQSIVDRFDHIIRESIRKSNEYPLDKFISWLNETKKRSTELFEVNFVDYQWFSLKILTPNRIYQFDPDTRRRFNPETDHILLKTPSEKQTEEYYKAVNTIWNIQPIKGEINNFKRRKHPKDFFSSKEGQKYINKYDFLPTKDLNNKIWDVPIEYI